MCDLRERMILCARVVSRWRCFCTRLAIFVCWVLSVAQASAAITYVQGNSATPQTPQTAVPVTFTGAQNVGDLNVIAVAWNDSTATVASVTDKSGNTYTRAVGPTVINGVESQSIYY